MVDSLMVVYGINTVMEALRAGRVRRLRVGPRADGRLERALEIARRTGIPIDRVDPSALERASRGGVHQGIVAVVEDAPDYSIAELLSHAAPQAPLIVVLDGIEDPHNVGAVLRTADAAGAHGVVRQARRAAPLDGIVAKASAGALAHVRVATVVNIARAVEELTAAGVWTVGLTGDALERYDRVDLTLPTAIVLGAEGSGLRRLVRERCDRLVSIPMGGTVESLNVSVAAGVTLFEAVRQRRVASERSLGPD
ncbi:MAG TPA: 23S rRNA (guanosine(2251)-2'-O)-methyltransferase RlmB [Vicinamibacterales bacterium]|nr:23S rRNA (guanosine(2251)-2'-O)-methyltransferase RlmB [Vicinamibacterales bacterium]